MLCLAANCVTTKQLVFTLDNSNVRKRQEENFRSWWLVRRPFEREQKKRLFGLAARSHLSLSLHSLLRFTCFLFGLAARLVFLYLSLFHSLLRLNSFLFGLAACSRLSLSLPLSFSFSSYFFLFGLAARSRLSCLSLPLSFSSSSYFLSFSTPRSKGYEVDFRTFPTSGLCFAG